MKQLLLFPLVSIFAWHTNQSPLKSTFHQTSISAPTAADGGLEITSQADGSSRMSAAVFKAQEFCRAELKDFEFDAHFRVVSATVYFSGTNFKNGAKGNISSSSLRSIKPLMDQCAPGSIVIFDEVKVVGPDDQLRTIPGLSLLLY